MKKHRIVVVGGGVAGLYLAGQLAGTSKGKNRYDVSLVDREPAHVWKPMLHTIAAGKTETGAAQTAYLVQAHQRGFRFELGEAVAVDRHAQRLELAPLVIDNAEILPARSLFYDTLILAAGSRANDFGMPGVAEHCMTIDCRREAIAFNERLRIAMLRTMASGDKLSIAIVGAGATGVELASELVRLTDVLEEHGARGLRGGLRITLIESQSRILGPFPENLASAAHQALERLGVTVLTSAKVQSVDVAGFMLADGQCIEADMTLWAAGVRASEFVSNIKDLDHSQLGQVVVDPTLRTPSDPHIFALGDCASATLPDRETPLATTAQAAYQQSIYLGRHLPRMLEGKTVPPFRYHDFGSLVSLGGYDAYGTLGRFGLFEGGFLRGRAAQLGHALLYRRHQARIYGPVRGGLLWLADSLSSSARRRERLA